MTRGGRDVLRSTRAGRDVPSLLQNEIAPGHNTLKVFDHLIYCRLVFIERSVIAAFHGHRGRIDIFRDANGLFEDR